MKLRLDAVRKSYDAVQALRQTSLEVRDGEFITLLGPSGSGKTTLLQILAGLIQPDGGEVWIDGTLATYTPPHRRGIGMVFQNYALFPHLTVAENIAFPLKMRRIPRTEIDRRVADILSVVQLPHVADRLPRALSGGQQQRIAFARCAVYEPAIILMDEPLGALDKKLRDQMQLEIKRLHKELGATILYVTHDQEEAMTMSDRICLMRDGAIEQLGTPSEVYFQPASRFAADFLGGSNIFDCRVAATEGDQVILEGPTQTRFVAPARFPVRSGDTVSLMVRPEHVSVVGVGTTPANSMDASLEQVIMSGATCRYYSRLSDGTPVASMHLTTDTVLAARAGQSIRLGWPSAHAVLLPAEAEP